MPTLISDENTKKIPKVKPLLQNFPAFSNIVNPFVPLANRFGSNVILRQYNYGKPNEIKIPVPGEGLPRVVHYCADQSGCAFWRMLWPAEELLAHNKAVVMTLYQMMLFGGFYQGIDAVKLQRQCTQPQMEFIKGLREISDGLKKHTGKGFRIIWEVDDICFPPQDIPDYNICKQAFLDPNIGEIVKQIITYCDEMTVVSPKMKEHYRKYLNFEKISVIPNYVPKMWADRPISLQEKKEKYQSHKQKPRILYAGSGTHFDVANKANQNDDFSHVVDFIARDLLFTKKYEWVFLGGLPMKLRQFINNGIEFHDWGVITEYPQFINKLNCDLMIAPLADNVFSRSKANIKLTEGGSLGIPVIAQNLDCYNSDGYPYLFNTADEMAQWIDYIMFTEDSYLEASKTAREYAEKYWLKDHLDEHMLLYTTEYGSEERKKNKSFYENNKDQFK